MADHSRRRGGLKRPRPLLAFSRFARCDLLSRSIPPLPNANSTTITPSLSTPPANKQDPISNRKTLKQIESSSDEEYEQQEVVGTVQVDFEFFDPKQEDFHGVKLLLAGYLDSNPWDLAGFVDLILAQTTVGTVVKSGNSESDDSEGDDEELFAVISALNLGRYREQRCMQELKQYILNVCHEESVNAKLRSLLEEKASDLGLLICERFVNCPYELVLKLYDSLFDEISWAIEDEPTQEIRDSFRFKYYLLVTKIFESKNLPQKQNQKRGMDQDEPVIYIHEEDEIFREFCYFSFVFKLSGEELAPPDLKNYKKMGLVMVIKAEDIPKFHQKLESLVDGS